MDEQDRTDELNRTYETSKTPEEPADPSQLDQPSSGPDALQAFLAAGGTFGMAIRDTLAQAQLDPTGAAKMSGEHLSNLLYGSHAVDQHTAPYAGRAYLNPNDYRDRDTNATTRRRRR